MIVNFLLVDLLLGFWVRSNLTHEKLIPAWVLKIRENTY